MFTEIARYLPERLGDFTPGAPLAARERWDAVPGRLRDRVLQEADDALTRPWPLITASAWREFSVSGHRAQFEQLYFTRRRSLNALVLGELLQNKGRFLPAIVDGVFLISEESGWQLPAHNASERSGKRAGLPDPARPVIDLFAAETAAQFASISGLLGEALDALDPAIRARILREVQARIFDPYLACHFWWMGRADERMNNWTAWITQNVLLATFALPTGQTFRRSVVEKALGSLDAFQKDYAEDGACEEGALYYRHAALCLHGALTILDTVAPGCFAALWRHPKIRNMAEHIVHLHVAGRHYFNFADSSAVLAACSAREVLFGQAVGSELLSGFAARDRLDADEPHLPQEWSLWYRALELLADATIAAPRSVPVPPRDKFYPGIGLFIARDDTFALAVKGGNNGESHNHNDVGSVTLYKNGKPFLVDVGVETYTAKTFSPLRYSIWTMQSAYHNLPDFSGIMQADGAAFAADHVDVASTDEEARISLDLAPAYPEEALLKSYRRTVRLVRGSHVEIADAYEGARDATLSLMLAAPAVATPDGIEIAHLGRIAIEGGGGIAIEPIEISDARLRLAWPARLYRLRVPFRARSLKLKII